MNPLILAITEFEALATNFGRSLAQGNPLGDIPVMRRLLGEIESLMEEDSHCLANKARFQREKAALEEANQARAQNQLFLTPAQAEQLRRDRAEERLIPMMEPWKDIVIGPAPRGA